MCIRDRVYRWSWALSASAIARSCGSTPTPQMAQGVAPDWAICGVGVLPQDRAMADALSAQDHLYTVMVKNPDGTRDARVIGSMVDYLFAPDDPERVVARLADPAVRIVSLTITEGGYSLDPSTGEFDPASPDVQADLDGRGVEAVPP